MGFGCTLIQVEFESLVGLFLGSEWAGCGARLKGGGAGGWRWLKNS